MPKNIERARPVAGPQRLCAPDSANTSASAGSMAASPRARMRHDMEPRLSSKQEQGRAWEAAALAYLRERGLVPVEVNFTCKLGEIDLVMRDGPTLVFVEVRQRAAGSQVGAAASISPAKARRVLRAAQYYLQRFRRVPPCRVDVVAIDGGRVAWLRNAIEA